LLTILLVIKEAFYNNEYHIIYYFIYVKALIGDIFHC